jgi:HD superfamily phosphohydrolase
MQVIRLHVRQSGKQVLDHQLQVALAASLVHDVGHGMFSHAFEEIGKKLGIRLAQHEWVSEQLIRDGEIAEQFRELGSGFAQDVADLIGSKGPSNLYGAVVSSQFDADRLDYMQRDRLMCGVQNSGIDFEWLIANLEVGDVPLVVDDVEVGAIPTFVLGPKAIHAAETFVLALFQLYPTIYLHKTTRGAEKLFSEIMLRVIGLIRDNDVRRTGLPARHAIARFARDGEKIENALALDDTVFWGSLDMLSSAPDSAIANMARRLKDRKLLKCVDIRRHLTSEDGLGMPPSDKDAFAEYGRKMDRLSLLIRRKIDRWDQRNSGDEPRVYVDFADRHPYKGLQESKGPLNQIRIRDDHGQIVDISDHSPLIARFEKFESFRAYVDKNDNTAEIAVHRMVESALKEESRG